MIFDFDHAPGLTEALRDWRGKKILPTDLGSAEIRGLGRELHRRSVFTARGTNAEHLQEIAEVVDDILSGKINMATGRWRIMRKLKQLGYDPTTHFPGDLAKVPPAERGSLQDLSSAQRIDLILETNVRMASNYARMVAGNTGYALHAYPAWELVRLFHRDTPRGSPESKSLGWERRWSDAGESVLWEGAKEKRMIARKDSPIWQALGDGEGGGYTDTLGNPYPPFAFRSGMAWRAVPRAECVALKLVTGGETPAKMEGRLSPGKNAVQRAMERLSPDLRAELEREFDHDATVRALAQNRARLEQRMEDTRQRQLTVLAEAKARSAQVQAEHRAKMEALAQ